MRWQSAAGSFFLLLDHIHSALSKGFALGFNRGRLFGDNTGLLGCIEGERLIHPSPSLVPQEMDLPHQHLVSEYLVVAILVLMLLLLWVPVVVVHQISRLEERELQLQDEPYLRHQLFHTVDPKCISLPDLYHLV